MAYIRRQFKGNASYSDALLSGITNSTTAITLKDGTTFPDGSVGPFVVTIDPGNALEEKVLVTTRSGANLQSCTRAYDGTIAQVHAANAIVQHTISAVDLDEANQAAHQLLGGSSTNGQIPYVTGAGTYGFVAAPTAGQLLGYSAGVPGWVANGTYVPVAVPTGDVTLPASGFGGTAFQLNTLPQQSFGGVITGTNLATGGTAGDSFGLLALSAGNNANLNSGTYDYLAAAVILNYTANGAGLVVGNYGKGDGIFASTQGTAAGTSFAINVWAGTPTAQTAVGSGICVSRYGVGNAIIITGESGSGTGTGQGVSLVSITQNVNSASIYVQDGGNTTGDTLAVVATAKTSGNMAHFFHSTSTFSGNAINLDLGNGGATFNGYFLACNRAGALQIGLAFDGSVYCPVIKPVGAGGINLGGGGNKVGLYGAAPVAQPVAIAAPSGGTTIDTQARAAITSILNALSAAAGGIGVTA